MAVIQEYKCPCCGGAVSFDSNAQKLKCPFCDTEYEVDALNQMSETSDIVHSEDKMDNWDVRSNRQFSDDELNGINTYICKSCGGEIIGDATLGASSCPFCGNPVVISDKFEGDLRPDLVIPFKLDKKTAKEAFLKHLSGKKLLPKLFRSENHIDEIKGLYVPFWLFDADVEGGVKYKATRTRRWSSGNYDYTEVKYYDIYREGNVSFMNIPADASVKMADDLMDSLEPFDFGEAVDFNTAYFAGYLADRYDSTVDDNIPRMNSRVKRSTEDVFRSTITEHYDTVSTENSFIDLQNGNVKYALLPVWILNTTWNGNKYTFAMNGQTGKFVGNLPMDRKLYWKYWFFAFLAGAPIGIIVGLIANFLLN